MSDVHRLPRELRRPYYSLDSYLEPALGQDLVLSMECPPLEFDNFSTGYVDFDPGPRMRVVIEGRTELVKELMVETQAKLSEIDARLKSERGAG